MHNRKKNYQKNDKCLSPDGETEPPAVGVRGQGV